MMQSCSAVQSASLGCRRAGEVCHGLRRWFCAELGEGSLSSTRPSIRLQSRSLTSRSISVQRWTCQSPPSRRLYSTNASSAETPHTSTSSVESLSEHFRSAMRLLTNPVVVLTASDGTHPRAMTMSSFTSLTLSPTPLVTFNVAIPSRTFDALSDRGEFNIHILSSDKHGATIADHFTKGNTEGVFNGVSYLDATSGPVLEGEGVLYVLRCRLAVEDAPAKGLVRVRDHVIVVAEVMEMMRGLGGEEEYGLAYTDRRYRRVGETIKKHE